MYSIGVGFLLLCMALSVSASDECTRLPTEQGVCENLRYFFDPATNDCRVYRFAGLACDDALPNTFKTLKHCRLVCRPDMFSETQCWDSLCAPGVECFRNCTSSYRSRPVSSADMNQETCCRGPKSGCEHLISPSGNPPTCYTDLCGGCAPRCYDSVTREYIGERMPYYEVCSMGDSTYANLQ